MSSNRPTDEQQAIINAAALGGNLVIQAGAGTGKTTTLDHVARNMPNRRGIYIAFNKSIADAAARKFPDTVLCKTSHSLAYGAVGSKYRTRLNGGRQRAQDTARHLRINEPLRLADDKTPLAPQQLARLVMGTLGRFCYSADEHITSRHVPHINNYDLPAERAELARYLVPLAQRAWDQDIKNTRGVLPFTHDMYLKLWILSRPQLNADYVLLDEAQDTNPALAGLVADQQAQRILVGDSCQAIYGWRGATDAMAGFDGDQYLLSQSFRFGPAIADEANKWLSLLDAPLRLRGFDAIDSRVDEVDAPDAILCRTNAGAVARVMQATNAGRKAALVGGGKEIRRMAEAARDLQTVGHTDHPELFAFTSWGEVQQYVKEDESASDLKVFVNLINTYGATEVMQICDRMVDERHADVIVSTAHKAKGLEWSKVLIDSDFTEPKKGEDGEVNIPRDAAMLAYVSVTRAQHVLDRTGLAWVDNHTTPAAAPVVAVEAPAPAVEPVAPTAPVEDATVAVEAPAGRIVIDGPAPVDPAAEAAEQEAWNELAAYVATSLPVGEEEAWDGLAAYVDANLLTPTKVAEPVAVEPATRCPRCRMTTGCACDPAAVTRFVALTGIAA